MDRITFRRLTLGFLLCMFVDLSSGSSRAQEAGEPEFVFDTGEPAWRGERIELPPGFAPDLGWDGVEHIRFAPGMFDPEAPGFFSYVLAFLLSPDDEAALEALEAEFLVYYRGLAESVMGQRGQSVD